MKIVVLDGFTMNPGDLDWTPLKSLGQVYIYPRTNPDQLLERAADTPILLTNKVVLGKNQIDALPDLRYIGVLATGYNVVDCQAAREKGIVVTNVPAYSTDSVAQMVFAQILHHVSAVTVHSASVHSGDWCASDDFAYQLVPITELRAKVMGIIGLGRIGIAVADIAKAFGMQVIAATRTPKTLPGVQLTDIETVLREADFISLHCPLTTETRGLINKDSLAMMKSTAYLINTGRGPLLDEQAVAEALNTRRIAGAGLDVLSSEPPSPDNPLLNARNCTITPHIAWATREARQRLFNIAVDNVGAFLHGAPINIVN